MGKPVLGILLGDPAGVGPEMIAKLCVSGFLEDVCRPVLIGDRRVLDRAFEVIESSCSIQMVGSIPEADWSAGIPLLHLWSAGPDEIPFGVSTPKGGRSCIDALDKALELAKRREISGICFGPLNKDMLKIDPAVTKADGTCFESEYHFIANRLGHQEPFGEINAVGNLWTTRSTGHIPLKDVSKNLTAETVGRAIDLLYLALKKAGNEDPSVAVAALNPHAGENGTCGTEEIDVIFPAVQNARQRLESIRISGPYPVDTLFVRAFRGDFDGVVTMYHDQEQIALKGQGFGQGVTIAGGFDIPIITVSHGPAYEIAGKNAVKIEALKNAVQMCAKIADEQSPRKRALRLVRGMSLWK